MNKIRAFIAVEIDPENKQKISALINRLKSSNADVKWITENQMHLTLKFLGNIEQDTVPKIGQALNATAKDFPAFSIQFSNIGAFPNIKKPRVIWMGLDKGGDILKQLNCKIETEMENLGFKKEGRGYKAHLTLGRVRSLKNLLQLTKVINEIKFETGEEIRIDKLILFQSTLTPKGAIYTPLTVAHI